MISIGPVTNVALAIKMDPEFIKRLKHLYVGAGNIESKCTLINLTETCRYKLVPRGKSSSYRIEALTRWSNKITAV